LKIFANAPLLFGSGGAFGQKQRKGEIMHLIVIIVLYLLLCLLMGLLGRNRKLGFWGYFFGSIILTPIIGLILLLASDPRKPAHVSK